MAAVRFLWQFDVRGLDFTNEKCLYLIRQPGRPAAAPLRPLSILCTALCTLFELKNEVGRELSCAGAVLGGAVAPEALETDFGGEHDFKFDVETYLRRHHALQMSF